jgi:hypothetical protein
MNKIIDFFDVIVGGTEPDAPVECSREDLMELLSIAKECDKLKHELYNEMLDARGITYVSSYEDETIDDKIKTLKILDDEGITQ